MFAISVEAIPYLLLYNLHDCTFKDEKQERERDITINEVNLDNDNVQSYD